MTLEPVFALTPATENATAQQGEQQIAFFDSKHDGLNALPAPHVPQPAPTTSLLVQPEGEGLVRDKKPESRVIISIAFSAKEAEYLKKILEARKGSKLSNSMHHMMRQMVNFAANFEEGWKFGRPSIERVILEQ
jgi:hypothetical protein